MAEGTGNGSVEIGGKDFNLFFIKFRVKELEGLNVLFIEDFAKVLMLSHSDGGQFAPNIVGGVAVIKGVEVGSGSVSEQTDNLVEFARTKHNEKE